MWDVSLRVKTRVILTHLTKNRKMEDFSKDYIYLDGSWLKEDQLLQMAFKCGSWKDAEHYLFAYLANAVINCNLKAIVRVNEMRQYYKVEPIPYTENNSTSGLQPKKRADNSADLARKKYAKFTWEQRKSVLEDSLKDIMTTHLPLFKSSVSWNGIFLVIRDRIDGSLKKSEFADMAVIITPEGWPSSLTITKSTLNNFSHYVAYPDSEEAYYDMDNCPWEDLCNTFWEILEQQILTKN